MTARRWTLSLALVALGGALTFLLGLFSGAPDDAVLTLYAVASFAVAAGIAALAVRLILGEWSDIEALLAPLGALLGGVLLAGFTEAFVVGISVAFHQGWRDRELQQFGGIDENWRSWLSELQRGAPAAGGIIGAFGISRLGLTPHHASLKCGWSLPQNSLQINIRLIRAAATAV